MKRFLRIVIPILIGVVIVSFIVTIVVAQHRNQLIYDHFSESINYELDEIYQDTNSVKPWQPNNYDQQSQLFYLCKVWGFAKYFGNNDNIEDVNEALMVSLDKVLNHGEMNKEVFCDIMQNLISSMRNDTTNGENLFPDISDYALVSNDWMCDTICLNDNVKHLLMNLFEHYDGNNAFAKNNSSTGVVKFTQGDVIQDISDVSVRLLGLFEYWNTMNYFYPNKNCMDFSWDLSLYEAIPCFIEADNEHEYRMAIYRLTNRLCDSHTSLPVTVDTFLFGEYRPEFRMELVDNRFVINKIRYPERKDCIFEIGDIILKISDEDPHKLYDSLQMFVCGGNDWSNQFFVCNAMLSRRETETEFVILRGNDTLFLKSHNERSKDLWGKRMKCEKQNEKKQLYSWIDDSTAYLDATLLTHKNFNKNYRPIKNAKTIILDLRCYPEQMLSVDIADHFVPSNSAFACFVYADARYPGMLRLHKPMKHIGKQNCYAGNIIVLVDENTKSYSEYLTMMLQANPKTNVIGKPTSGAVGNAKSYDFPGKITTMYTSIGILYPDLTPTQRCGVKIDSVCHSLQYGEIFLNSLSQPNNN